MSYFLLTIGFWNYCNFGYKRQKLHFCVSITNTTAHGCDLHYDFPTLTISIYLFKLWPLLHLAFICYLWRCYRFDLLLLHQAHCLCACFTLKLPLLLLKHTRTKRCSISIPLLILLVATPALCFQNTDHDANICPSCSSCFEGPKNHIKNDIIISMVNSNLNSSYLKNICLRWRKIPPWLYTRAYSHFEVSGRTSMWVFFLMKPSMRWASHVFLVKVLVMP